MTKNKKISEAEMIVMEVLWNKGRSQASEIIESLSNKEEWNDKTIRTLLNRLVAKKVLGVVKYKFYEFYPLVTREECVQEATISFLDRFYNGSIGHLVSNFVNNNQLSENELITLEKLIEEKKKQATKDNTDPNP